MRRAASTGRRRLSESCVARHTWHTGIQNVCFARTMPRLNLIHSEATFVEAHRGCGGEYYGEHATNFRMREQKYHQYQVRCLQRRRSTQM